MGLARADAGLYKPGRLGEGGQTAGQFHSGNASICLDRSGGSSSRRWTRQRSIIGTALSISSSAYGCYSVMGGDAKRVGH